MLCVIEFQFFQHDLQALIECAFSVLGDDEQSGGEGSNLAVVRHAGLTQLGIVKLGTDC